MTARLDDPNALWRAVHRYTSTGERDVREALAARHRRVATFRRERGDEVNAAGHRLLERAAFALYLDARCGETTPLRVLLGEGGDA